jgi:hypothetical protein
MGMVRSASQWSPPDCNLGPVHDFKTLKKLANPKSPSKPRLHVAISHEGNVPNARRRSAVETHAHGLRLALYAVNQSEASQKPRRREADEKPAVHPVASEHETELLADGKILETSGKIVDLEKRPWIYIHNDLLSRGSCGSR